MTGADSCHRVRDLMKQHLVGLVVVETRRQVFRHGDALSAVVAEPGAGLRVVEAERPFRGVEMQRNESIRPPPYSHQISHGSTITRNVGPVSSRAAGD